MPTDETYYDDQTLVSVYDVLTGMGYTTRQVSEIIFELEDVDIVFRERA